MLIYQIEKNLSIDEFIEVLVNSTLGERRPVNEPDRIAKMLEHANLIITARLGGKLVGVARSLTDFLYCTYLSDLAVDNKFQKQGIGKEPKSLSEMPLQHAFHRSGTYCPAVRRIHVRGVCRKSDRRRPLGVSRFSGLCGPGQRESEKNR